MEAAGLVIHIEGLWGHVMSERGVSSSGPHSLVGKGVCVAESAKDRLVAVACLSRRLGRTYRMCVKPSLRAESNVRVALAAVWDAHPQGV